ncbi:Glucosamine--fructose-6-phosphate aminotransferase (isomerizing) [Caldalkalibacillus thermarum TA2.A1]|uniref:Glutamine--fructose-6-phosphate aminotransferase [isomerizing] n=1 Tax=Caldalkalibacillus thermarum (strain TA2.A1) TaxID=986075 RepID=F5L522_CALTT|nr:glutamine--fructose-6-phosphate transaminase (isomerizing) [Caldalkalibacillus thermarum]EGL83559.1 Glucosamine--fructose-6-phosphate aminotransferase (isomerizing) [Caldalkalibacillus thermarum TA2.A1]QZT34494.1 glutamine--fructose-6-phosphate transaminase (isomerizing) [Caldalkalibacillus thermarum TA2.A1]
MCGIVGYIGFRQAKETILTGLKRLEYRGYDSAGIGIVTDEDVEVYKEKGKIEALERLIKNVEIKGTVGIGHTRWATHGVPNQINAHPHQSYSGRYTIVHNGIIENYKELIETYIPNIKRESETDTEVIAHLVDHFSQKGLSTEEAFREVIGKLEGSFAIVLIDGQDTSRLYAAKNKSPLLAGLGQGENMVASDATAMIHVTNTFKELKDGEYVVLDHENLIIKTLDGDVIDRDVYTVDWDTSSVETGAYEHFMLKEIDEQPAVIRNIITQYQDEQGQLNIGRHLQGLAVPSRVYIVACGTSYHAGLVGKRLLEQIAHIPTEVHIASEFLYDQPLIEGDPLFIFISQSGETADSRGVLDQIKKQGYRTLTVTNVQGSTLYREADYKLLTHAGPEIAVASTKAYTAQIAVVALLSIYLAEQKGIAGSIDMFQELRTISTAMDALKDMKDKAKHIVEEYLTDQRSCFFIGRLLDYAVCLEGALKLKEISYIQAEGYAGGELKHGPIALIEDGTPVFVLITDQRIAKNIRSNAEEVVSRGAKTCVIAAEGLHEEGDQWVLPRVHPLLTPLVSVIPLQLIAYYAALERGCDVDKPRNLAKSVTVE